ncbi:lon-related putative ATP-dependent protease [Geoalkalibacter ferrihydriticus]|uniref:endopeptidase La n=2 Tax=Geoalkalibacter ferrihydriticus TaxID=392333 RepID=A0A0C2DUG4_9BACT|nr:ATP-binding protein [Geoalkalibacter ferrihydriticus]KIH77079.1 ATP-dependent protease [Geoalkalibacter ferrihydriticus DSM 17813]SDL35640.1 lon-related putative ATP-dependent protease [Geoalkalibacter ferrihydriticus]
MALDHLRLETDSLTWRCDPNQFEFETTRDLPPLEGTIGQERAMTAIDFGLGIKDSGFNVFILGEPGTGRSSTIKKILNARAKEREIPDDWCYVHDFNDGTRPDFIRLPAGQGSEFKKDVDRLVERLAEELPRVFESKEYEEQKSKIAAEHQEKHKALFQQLEHEAEEKGFTLQRTVSGLVLVPVRDGHPLSQEEYENLSDEEKTDLDERGSKLQDHLNDVLRDVRRIEEDAREATAAMEKEVVSYAMKHLFVDLEQKYAEDERILEHFTNCKKDILNRIEELRPNKGPQIALPGIKMPQQEASFDRYLVNLFVDNHGLEGAPVVYEANPTYFNLFGRIEHVIQMGNATTDYKMIKPGALHRANGGYLILDCREVLINLFSYEALKRCIRNKEVKIEDMTEQFRLLATVSLKPRPVPLDCKIIMIGTPLFYYLLFQYDTDFRKYFKVKADFDRMMKNTWENAQQYALFIGAKCRDEALLHFDPTAVARTVEHSARLTEDQARFSSCFLEIANLIREAAFYAERDGGDRVAAEHVELAIEARTYRCNKVEEKIQEFIEDGTLLVDTEGAVVGQINGLTVYQLGDYSFGKPVRLTVRTYLGKGGMVNIEREVKLSGPIHDKGVMIFSGFFGERFAQDKPLALAASICFEQSYAGVEGDSASCAELYALLSSLAQVPIKQGIAVTGSVNQRGQVQPIGGVNEKIEGFYLVCKAKGLTGEQGVIIPEANRRNLMLNKMVREAVEQGRFHIWSVTSVDEGIEILTGMAAGERDAEGRWAENTINQKVDQRLLKMAETLRKFGKGEEKNEK